MNNFSEWLNKIATIRIKKGKDGGKLVTLHLKGGDKRNHYKDGKNIMIPKLIQRLQQEYENGVFDYEGDLETGKGTGLTFRCTDVDEDLEQAFKREVFDEETYASIKKNNEAKGIKYNVTLPPKKSRTS